MIELKITVPEHAFTEGPEDYAKRYLDSCLSALGFARQVGAQLQPLPATAAGQLVTKIREAEFVRGQAGSDLAPTNGVSAGAGETAAEGAQTAAADAPQRERGKAAPGRTRRTKAEIAEDEAADAADAENGTASGNGNISTDPENRVNPEETEDDVSNVQTDSPEADAQDEADEKAEMAKAAEAKAASEDPKKKGAALLEQVRGLMGDVAEKHNILIASKIPNWLGKPIAEMDETALTQAVKRIGVLLKLDLDSATAMLEGVEGDAGLDLPPEPKPAEPAKLAIKPGNPSATKDQVTEALYAYAEYADGTKDQAKMTHTMVDVPAILTEFFGVKSQSALKPEQYGDAVQLVRDAIATDHFKRKRG